jgi:hypothetical protein
MIHFRELGFEDSSWLQPNRLGPVEDFHVSGVELLLL